MPELPEVQAVVDSLHSIVGQRIRHLTIHRDDITRQIDPAIASRLPSRTIKSITRRAKLVVFHLDDSSLFTVHLGMTGRLLLNPQTKPHTHVTFSLSDATLCFIDPRRFGRIRLSLEDDLAPEPLTISVEEFARRLAKTSRPLKSALLDQRSIVAGLGNIYIDETLHAAGLHPSLACDRIHTGAIQKLHSAMISILQAAIACGGSTLKDTQYVSATGRQGSFQSSHRVYARAGQPCLTCGKSTLEACIHQQRTTVFCPTCQPLHGVSGM